MEKPKIKLTNNIFKNLELVKEALEKAGKQAELEELEREVEQARGDLLKLLGILSKFVEFEINTLEDSKGLDYEELFNLGGDYEEIDTTKFKNMKRTQPPFKGDIKKSKAVTVVGLVDDIPIFDYLPITNTKGVDTMTQDRPTIFLENDEQRNIFNILVKARQTLKENNVDEATIEEMLTKAQQKDSYDGALRVISKYVIITGNLNEEEKEFLEEADKIDVKSKLDKEFEELNKLGVGDFKKNLKAYKEKHQEGDKE